MSRRGRKTTLNAAWRDRNRKHVARDVIVAPTKERAAKGANIDFPLDRLLHRQMISEEQHRAGWMFVTLRIAVFGAPHAKSASIYARIAGEIAIETGSAEPTMRDVVVERRYHHARNALLGFRRRVFDHVDNVCVHLREPSDYDIGALRDGLDILVRIFESDRARIAA